MKLFSSTVQLLALLSSSSVCGAMRVGGYSQVDPDGLKEPMLVNAARHAVTQYLTELPTKSRLDRNRLAINDHELPVDFKILDAMTQVVAGMNFKMRIELLDTVNNDCLEIFDAVVYDHFGDLSVTSFGEDPIECS